MDRETVQSLDVDNATVVEDMLEEHKSLEFPEGQEKDLKVQRTGTSEKAYSVFSQGEKYWIVGLASFATLFSPLTTTIYLPAIPTLADDFHTSVQAINLTVTFYMVAQGVAPMFWGSLGDVYGRRLTIIGCLAFLFGACIGLALTPTDAYWLLLFLRIVQSFGSASTVALGNGVISDIVEPHERGNFMALSTIAPMLAPSLAPVIGGILSDGLGWRSIFWFLVIASGLGMVVIILIFPETLRSIVDDGSIEPPRLLRPVFPIFTKNKIRPTPDVTSTTSLKRKSANPLLAFRLYLYPDCLLTLVANAIIYAAYYTVLSTISSLYLETYTFLNDTTVGLCYLPSGFGMMFGGVAVGRLTDKSFRSVKEKILTEQDPEKPVNLSRDFPLEYARLKIMPPFLLLFVVSLLGYGWAVQTKTNIAVPLILQFCVGLVSVPVFNCTQILILDILPGYGSSVTACNNLVRCSFGAAAVAFIDPLTRALKPGWTYVLIGGISFFTVTPMCLLLLRVGPRWRVRRLERENIVIRIR